MLYNQPQQNNHTESNSGGNSNSASQPLADLVETMSSVDTNSTEAQLNVTSIDDNNGGRIELNEDKIGSTIIIGEDL